MNLLRAIVAILLFCSGITPSVGAIHESPLLLPKPGQMVLLSPAFNPVVLKGIKLDPDNPFRFHFYVDQGDLNVGNRHAYSLRQESEKLIKYFLASLTIPEKDLWVNLSPSDWVK